MTRILRRAAIVVAALVAVAPAPSVAGAAAKKPQPFFANLHAYTAPDGYIAHAFGSIDGYPYTNTKEAFRASYAKGFRLFECDLVVLRDGTVVIAHNGTEKLYGLKKSWDQATVKDLKGIKYRGKYTVLTSRGLISLMRSYPDVRIILDWKWGSTAVAKAFYRESLQDPFILDRLIFHVSGSQMLAEMRKVYPFHTMYALYKAAHVSNSRIISFVRRVKLDGVMMRAAGSEAGRSRIYSAKLAGMLRRAGIPTYVYDAPNGAAGVRKFRKLGIGVYSDGWFAPTSDTSPRAKDDVTPPLPAGWTDGT